MDSGRWLVDFLTSPATPLWATFLVVAVVAWKISVAGLPAIVMAFIERRRAVLAEKAADRDFLREEVGRLETRCERLEDRDDECRRELAQVHDDLADARGRIRELEGYMTGQGTARQEAAQIVAIERLLDKEKEKGGGK